MTDTPGSHDVISSSGSDAALTELVREHKLTAQRSLRAVLGVSPDEEDLVQEVLTRLVIRLRQPGEIAVGAWTWRVAHNVAVDHLRVRRPTPADHTTLDRGVGDGLDDHVVGTEVAAAISVGLSRLPGRQRDALLARAVLDGGRGGHALVATKLGVSPKAAESILARARHSMRRELERFGLQDGPFAIAGIALRALGRVARRKGAAVAGVALIATATMGTTAALVYRTVAPHATPTGVTGSSGADAAHRASSPGVAHQRRSAVPGPGPAHPGSGLYPSLVPGPDLPAVLPAGSALPPVTTPALPGFIEIPTVTLPGGAVPTPPTAKGPAIAPPAGVGAPPCPRC
jgi:DNA-directed RNA polymerase specialized sigma24 family protein